MTPIERFVREKLTPARIDRILQGLATHKDEYEQRFSPTEDIEHEELVSDLEALKGALEQAAASPPAPEETSADSALDRLRQGLTLFDAIEELRASQASPAAPPQVAPSVALREETPKTGETTGLWSKSGFGGGKYLVQRRDGTVPEWPAFILGARDPASPAALRAYARMAEMLGFNPKFVADVRTLADEFDAYRAAHGKGDPDAVPHRKDDPAIIAKMQQGKSA